MKREIGFLFDLDGVLIDSENEYTRIWTEIDRKFPTGKENFALKIKGQTLPEILAANFDPAEHDAVVKMLNEKEQKMHYNWLPGAKEILEELTEAGYECVLVTSSNELKMKHLREEREDLICYFKDIVTADRITRSKPDPEGYLLGASILQVSPRCCFVFEDSLQGVRAGEAAGSFVVGLSTTLPVEVIEPHCNIVINNLSETGLDDLIEKLAINE